MLFRSETGLPNNPGQAMNQDRQSYSDLQMAIGEGRIRVMNYGWASQELLQLEDTGKSISGIKETCDGLAGLVGHLSKFGHVLLESNGGDDYVTIEDVFGQNMSYSPLSWGSSSW